MFSHTSLLKRHIVCLFISSITPEVKEQIRNIKIGKKKYKEENE